MRNYAVALPFVEVITDRAGRFSAEDLRPGRYELAVDARDHFPLLKTVQVKTGLEPLGLDLPQGKTLSGTFTDSDDKPVTYRHILIYQQNYQRSYAYRRFGLSTFKVMTDKRGRFAFHGLPEGELFRVNANFQIDGQRYRTNTLQNVEADADDVDLVLNGTLPEGKGR